MQRASHRIGRAVIVAGAVTAGLFAAPALAHQTVSLHPDGSYAYVPAAHTSIIVCDQDNDGNYAYARRVIGGVIQPPVYDPDGSGPQCGSAPIDPNLLERYAVCVQNEACGNVIFRPF